MSLDELTLAPTPVYEDCAQVGTPDYTERAKAECQAFIGQLKRVFGEPPEGARLKVKGNLHDVGASGVCIYYEVAVVFDGANPRAVDYAYTIDDDLPKEWDDEARAELGLPVEEEE